MKTGALVLLGLLLLLGIYVLDSWLLPDDLDYAVMGGDRQ